MRRAPDVALRGDEVECPETLGSLSWRSRHAAIQSVHNLRAAAGRTDWVGISRLYDGLVRLAPSLGTAVARAAAHREAQGAEAALLLLNELPDTSVVGYQPYWVLRAHCERDLALPTAAAAAGTAIGLTSSLRVADHLRAVLLSPATGTRPAREERR